MEAWIMDERDRTFFDVKFLEWYAILAHGYVALLVCIVGSLINVANVAVYTYNITTYSQARGSHRITSALMAVCDLLYLLGSISGIWCKYLKPLVVSTDEQSNECKIVCSAATDFFLPTIEIFSIWVLVVQSYSRCLNIVSPFKMIFGDFVKIYISIIAVFVLCPSFQLANVLFSDSRTKSTVNYVVTKAAPIILKIAFDLRSACCTSEIRMPKKFDLLWSSSLHLAKLLSKKDICFIFNLDRKQCDEVSKNLAEVIEIIKLFGCVIPSVVNYFTDEYYCDTFKFLFTEWETRDMNNIPELVVVN